MFGALVVLQQIDNEGKKEKLRKRKRRWVRSWIARRQKFGAFDGVMKEIKVEDPKNLQTL